MYQFAKVFTKYLEPVRELHKYLSRLSCVSILKKLHVNPREVGDLPNVGYMGMCHRPGSIFHFQKSRTGPEF